MRMTLLVDLLAHDNEAPTNDPADAIKVRKLIEESSVTEVSRHFPRVISDGATDEVVILPDPTTDYLLILTDQQISVKLNGSSDPQVLKPKAAGSKTPVMLIRGDITGLTVSNSSGNDANMDITLVKI